MAGLDMEQIVTRDEGVLDDDDEFQSLKGLKKRTRSEWIEEQCPSGIAEGRMRLNPYTSPR